jgi:PAS domain S-box-containing protein
MTKTFADITYPDDLEHDVSEMRRMLAGEIDSYLMEKRYYRKDGSVVWVNLTVSMTRKADGSPDYVIKLRIRKVTSEIIEELTCNHPQPIRLSA